MAQKEEYINFDEYIRQGEPQMKEKAEAWRVAIGLQAVDGLKTSEYLQQTARRNIEGEITIDEARELVKQYYISKTTHDEDDADKEEADRVSSNISKLLQTDAFTYSAAGLAAIHRAIFERMYLPQPCHKSCKMLYHLPLVQSRVVKLAFLLQVILNGHFQILPTSIEYGIPL